MNAPQAVVTNLIFPLVIALVLSQFSPVAAIIVGIVYLLGGAIALMIERDGGEHPAVVFTGWYVFLMVLGRG